MAETDDIRGVSTRFRTTRFPSFQGGEIDSQGNLAPVSNLRNPQPAVSASVAEPASPQSPLGGIKTPELPDAPGVGDIAVQGAGAVAGYGAQKFGEGAGAALEAGKDFSGALTAGKETLGAEVSELTDSVGKLFGAGEAGVGTATARAAAPVPAGGANAAFDSLGTLAAGDKAGTVASTFGGGAEVNAINVGTAPVDSLGAGAAGSGGPQAGSAAAGAGGEAGAAAGTGLNSPTFGGRLTSGANIGASVGAGIAAAGVALITGASPGQALKSGAGTAVGTAVGNAIVPGIGGIVGGFIGGALGGRVVCTELALQGKMSPTIMLADVMHARQHVSQETIDGYHAWALDVVRWMRRDDWLGKLTVTIAKPLATWRAHQTAYEMGWLDTPCWEGKFIRWVGEPICGLIGAVKGASNYRELYQEA